MPSESVVFDDGPVFQIRVDYEPNSPDPAHVFRAMSGLIDALGELELDLARSIAVRLEPVLVLEEIRTGSLITVIRTVIRALDPELDLLPGWELPTARYLRAAVMRVVDFLENRDTVESIQAALELQGSLLELAEETGTARLPYYAPVPVPELLQDVRRIGTALSDLKPQEMVAINAGLRDVPINKDFRLTPEQIEELLTADVLTQHPLMELVVKKPDYLGNSMWQFRHGDHVLDAKILDREWLWEFQSGQVPLRPGDALRAEVLIEARLGRGGEIVSIHHTVIDVVEVVHHPIETQEDLPFTSS